MEFTIFNESNTTILMPELFLMESNFLPMDKDPTLWVILDLSLCVFITATNIFSIIVIYKCSKLDVIANRFLICLALADLLVGVTLPYRSALTLSKALLNTRYGCLGKFVLLLLGCAVSVCSLSLIAIDRYIFIIHPLHYPNIITERIARSATAFVWLYSSFFASMILYWNVWDPKVEHKRCTMASVASPEYIMGILGSEYVILLLIMIVVYHKIQHEAHRQLRRFSSKDLYSQKTARSQLRSIQTITVILGCFILAWLPYLIISSIQSLNTKNRNLDVAYEITTYMGISNSGLNPFLYVWKNRDMKETIKSWFLRLQGNPKKNLNGNANEEIAMGNISTIL